jgi:glycosyltransferase involved in cell wall biosynthesis
MVMVSVLMGSYNHEKYLAEAIESVLNQTFSDLELIIIDDGSTDRSKSIIANYQAQDSRVKAVLHDKNMGIPRSINDGLKKATGKYLAFIGSDDVYMPDKLEKQVPIIEQNQDKIVWSEAEIIDGKGQFTGETTTKLLNAPEKKNGNLFQELLMEDFILGQSILVKTKFAQEIGFNENLKYVNDHLFFLNLSKNHDFIFVPEPLTKYRLHGGNISLKNNELWLKERIILRKYLLEKYGDEISNCSLSNIYYKLGHAFWGLDDTGLSRHSYVQAIRVYPFHANSVLYTILFLTNGEGKVGKFLVDWYQKIALVLS